MIIRSIHPEQKVNLALLNMVSNDPSRTIRPQNPFAVETIAGYLRAKTGAQIRIYDMSSVFEKMPADIGHANSYELFYQLHQSEAQKMLNFKPQVIGLSMKWDTVEAAEKIIESVIEAGHNPLFVLGSYIPTFASDELLTRFQGLFPGAKIVAVLGEGEDALFNILNKVEDNHCLSAEDLAGIPNVKVTPGGTVNFQRVNLNEYPILTPENAHEIFSRNVIPIETSRGCPWAHCTFCSVRNLYGSSLGEWMAFPVEYILDRMKTAAERGIHRFYIIDSEFIGPMNTEESFKSSLGRAEALALGLIELNRQMNSQGERLSFAISNFSLRADAVYRADNKPGTNEESRRMLTNLKEAGFNKVYLGIESGSSSQLKRFGKGTTVEVNENALNIARELGIEVEAGFIFFDPMATINELRESLDFIERTQLHNSDSRIFGSLRVQAGSPLHKALDQRRLITGPLDLNSLEYPAEYHDPHVKLLNDMFTDWEKQTRALTRVLASHQRRQGLTGDPDSIINGIISCLRELDFILIKELCQLNFEDLQNSGVTGRILTKHLNGLNGIRNNLRRMCELPSSQNLPTNIKDILNNSEAETKALLTASTSFSNVI